MANGGAEEERLDDLCEGAYYASELANPRALNRDAFVDNHPL